MDRPVVMIEWIDPASNEGGWVSAEEFEPGYVTCQSVGFLYAEDEEKVCIVAAFTSDGQLDHATTIPRVCVRSMVTLRNGPSRRVTRRRGA